MYLPLYYWLHVSTKEIQTDVHYVYNVILFVGRIFLWHDCYHHANRDRFHVPRMLHKPIDGAIKNIVHKLQRMIIDATICSSSVYARSLITEMNQVRKLIRVIADCA